MTTARSVDEMAADLIEGARALADLIEDWNPEAIKASDIASADALLVGLARVMAEIRRARR